MHVKMENLEKHYMVLLTGEEQQLLKLKPFELLRNKPYPVLDILLLQSKHNYVYIKKKIIETFEELLKSILQTGVTINFLKFLVRMPADVFDSLQHENFSENLKLCINNSTLNKQLYFSLIAHKEKHLILDVLDYLKTTRWQYFSKPLGSKQFILHYSLNSRSHFLNALLKENCDFDDIDDIVLRNNLIILKLVHDLSKSDLILEELNHISKLLDSLDIETIKEEELKTVYTYFYKHFKRLAILIGYIRKHPNISQNLTVTDVLRLTSPLVTINKYKLLSSFEQAKSLIESYYACHADSPLLAMKEQELELLYHYFILSEIIDIITQYNHTTREEFLTEKIQTVNNLLRLVKNFESLCKILDDILCLIYMRWEQTNEFSTSKGVSHFSKSSSSSPSYTDDDVGQKQPSKTKPIKANVKPTKTGFICKSKSFSIIFNFLKMFVTKKLHSADFKQATPETKQKCQKILDLITEILWKYDFFEKLQKMQRQTQNNEIVADFGCSVMNFIQFHPDSMEPDSSEDEVNQNTKHNSWQSRRKSINKRRRSNFCGNSISADEIKFVRTRTLTSTPNAFDESMTRTLEFNSNVLNLVEEEEETRSIVPKLLTSPEKLAVLTLSLKLFQETKQIIENFDLQNSQMLQDLEFMEHQKQVKEKLTSFYNNYLQQESQTRNANKPLATVEQIRNVAAKGFEVSKIISYVDYFAQTHPICQTESVKGLVRKHKSNFQYRFLSQFEEPNLNAVIICDLILSLPFNRDIISSVLMVIKRHQSIQSTSLELEGPERSQLPTCLGPLSFLENLDECMRIQDDKSIKDLLIDNIYTLKADKMAKEMLKEQVFKKVLYKTSCELSTCEDLKALIPQFQALNSKYNHYQKFCFYMDQLAKLVRLKDAKCTCRVEELLHMDPYDIIGDLVFSCEISLQDIEALVMSLNLNLVHVICLNLCPEIGANNTLRKRLPNAENKSKFLNYISKHNGLLKLLLEAIDDMRHISNVNARFLEKLVHMPEIEKLSSLYGGNKVIAALKSDHINVQSLELDNLDKLMQLELGIQELKLITSLDLDSLIIELIHENPSNIYLASKIRDITLRANVIHENYTKIPTTRMAKELIEGTLWHSQAAQRVPEELQQILKVILDDITIYAKVSEVMEFEAWPQAYDFGLKTPTTIFKSLLQRHLYKLCYEWCKVVKLSTNFPAQQQQIMKILLEALIDKVDDENDAMNIEFNANEYLLQILETFPPADCRSFLDSNKYNFRSLALLKYCIQFLESYKEAEVTDNLINYKISILIFEQLTPGIRRLVWHLLRYPLLIIEQLIMNAKFEILTKVLTSIRHELALQSLEGNNPCPFCFDKNGNVYDIHNRSPNVMHNTRFQLGANDASSTSLAFILLNFNLYQPNHVITNDCIDFLLRIYATKALDYQLSDINSQSQPSSQSTNSLDSLCGEFKMPPQAPVRSDWVRDEDATHCMCCRRAAFTMLNRRHHCRRCGRVVCYACSTHRMRIQELYEDVEVRVCNDCYNLSQDLAQRRSGRDSQPQQAEDAEFSGGRKRQKHNELFKWKLSGNITHDKVVREEFCYEHAPSVALCLSILDHHLGKQKCVDLLLFHCRKLEKLIIPNPEVDLELVSKMMKCLALAAKVRGGPAEVETIQEHSEIIISLVQNGCEALIPPDTFGDLGLRKLADSLVQAERWDLALEVHLKFGLSTTGVMVAHGLSCLRAGCYDTAREKFNHCMTKLVNEEITSTISKVILNPAIGPTTNDNASIDSILGLTKDHDDLVVKRPQNGPPLLQEILKLLESLPFSNTQQEPLQRTSIIRNSNTSLANLLSLRKEPYVERMHEPSLNIRNTLANLKRISKGQYNVSNSETNDPPLHRKEIFCTTRAFEECLHYVLTYGSHVDVVHFLICQRNLMASLKYYLLQKLDAEIFINHIYMKMLKTGKICTLIKLLLEFDSCLLIWQPTLLKTCRFLESQNLLNSLYELQILLNDPVRAAMTCVKFYTMNCNNFQQQHLNAQHLLNAQMHLHTELEKIPYVFVNLNTPPSTKSQTNSSKSSMSSNGAGNFQLQMDGRSLNAHSNTIGYQLEVAKFLSRCEIERKCGEKAITEKVLKEIRFDTSKGLPTLFDRNPEKIQICLLILLCGKNIEEGFGLAYRIIQHYKLAAMKVYAAATRYLVQNQRILEVEKLIHCITSNNGISTHDIDEILSVAINSAVKCYDPDVRIILNSFAQKIHSIELSISCNITIGQLKTAYLLANKYERIGDIRKILRKAEATNQVHIKNLCEKKLQMFAAQGK